MTGVVVLGMHRSGTSCLAGSLEQQGLFLGEVNTSAPWNRRGNRERFDVMNLQGDILEASGGSDIYITVNKEMTADASGGSDIYYKGTGLIREIKSSGSSGIKKVS